MRSRVFNAPRPRTQWHTIFCWRPRRVYAGRSSMYCWVWLEHIQRKYTPGSDVPWWWEYKLIRGDPPFPEGHSPAASGLVKP